MNPHVACAASLLSAPWTTLGDTATTLINAGIHRLHLDVMDQHYVPNLSLGPRLCRDLRDHGIEAPIDCHLMTEPVDATLRLTDGIGATTITFHPTTSPNLAHSIATVRAQGAEVGLALNPNDDPNLVVPWLDHISTVLVMGVTPGWGGQTMDPRTFERVRFLAERAQRLPTPPIIDVDGGVKPEHMAALIQAGARRLVIGSALFDGHASLTQRAHDLVSTLQDLAP